MSVLKFKRNESKAEYVNVAYQIVNESSAFIIRMSNRYQRFLGPIVLKKAAKVFNNAQAGNDIRVTDQVSYDLRKRYLLKSRAAVRSLDTWLLRVYETLMDNPEGAFATANGKLKTPKEAADILDRMAENIGCKIDDYSNLVTKVMESDKARFKKLQAESQSES